MPNLATLKQTALAPGLGSAEADALMAASGLRVADDRVRGRGAGLNMSGRFEITTREVFDDGWSSLRGPAAVQDGGADRAFAHDHHQNTSPDISFDRSINPYRGCEHGCVYCFARPTHAYMGLSAGSISRRLFAKPDAPRLLEKEITRPGYQVQSIAIGTNTDPYQPDRKEWRIMRSIARSAGAAQPPGRHRHQVALVTRDIDILSRMASKGLARWRFRSRRWTASWRAPWSRAPRHRRGGWKPSAS
jgi:hypothetical protein